MIKILLIDDNVADVRAFQEAFRKNRVANPLFIAHNGREALDMLRGTNGKEKIEPTPKIIVTDLNMPKMDGLEFLKELRADKDLHAISVFVLTNSHDDKSRVDAHNYNVSAYINKPVAIEGFMVTLATLRNYWKLCFTDEIEIKELDNAN